MTFARVSVVGLIALACARENPVPQASPQPKAAPEVAPARPAAVPEPRRHVTERWSFEIAEIRLQVVDAQMSTRLDRIFDETGAELVVNGGFFDKRLKPHGLVVSEGKLLSPLVPELSGGVLWLKGGRAGLAAAETYAESDVDFAVQCLPRLVVEKQVNVRTTPGPRAARTAICLRNGGRTLEFVVAPESLERPGPTLFELAGELAQDGCESALNLDGGPSTGWVSRSDAGRSLSLPRAGVRHAIVVTRSAPGE